MFFCEVLFGTQVGGSFHEVFSPAVSHLAQPLLLSQGAHQFALLSPLFTWFLRNFPQRQKGVRCEIQKQNRQPICAKRRCIYMYIYGHEFLVGIKRADSGPCCFNTYSTKPSEWNGQWGITRGIKRWGIKRKEKKTYKSVCVITENTISMLAASCQKHLPKLQVHYEHLFYIFLVALFISAGSAGAAFAATALQWSWSTTTTSSATASSSTNSSSSSGTTSKQQQHHQQQQQG